MEKNIPGGVGCVSPEAPLPLSGWVSLSLCAEAASLGRSQEKPPEAFLPVI